MTAAAAATGRDLLLAAGIDRWIGEEREREGRDYYIAKDRERESVFAKATRGEEEETGFTIGSSGINGETGQSSSVCTMMPSIRSQICFEDPTTMMQQQPNTV